jgi:hypothetical protein
MLSPRPAPGNGLPPDIDLPAGVTTIARAIREWWGALMADKVFRDHNGTPLLGEAPPPEGGRLTVRLTLEFQPDLVPPDRRLAQLLKLALRCFKAKNKECVEVKEE